MPIELDQLDHARRAAVVTRTKAQLLRSQHDLDRALGVGAQNHWSDTSVGVVTSPASCDAVG